MRPCHKLYFVVRQSNVCSSFHRVYPGLEAETSRNYNSLYQSVRNSVIGRYQMSAGESLASSAVKTAIDVDARLLVVLSETGNTARNIAKYRPGKT